MENRGEKTSGKGFAEIGQEILFAARNELYLNLPYLDVALCALAFRPGGGCDAVPGHGRGDAVL